MHSIAPRPRRPARQPPAPLLVLLLVAIGCAAGERDKDQGGVAPAPAAGAEAATTEVATADVATADVATAPAPKTQPAPEIPAEVPAGLERISLRVLGMT